MLRFLPPPGHEERTLFILLLFGIGLILFGLALDLAALVVWRGNRKKGLSGPVGLPYVPWMIYFLASFFWWLRGNFLIGLALLIVLTIWHVALHVTIHSKGRTAAGH
jgi:hypothetical protein